MNGVPVTGNYGRLRDLLIKSLKKKFQYELSSDVYLVASLFLTSKLHMWYKRSFGKVFASGAVAALVKVCMKMKPLKLPNPITEAVSTPVTTESPSLMSKYSQVQSESEGEAKNFSFS